MKAISRWIWIKICSKPFASPGVQNRNLIIYWDSSQMRNNSINVWIVDFVLASVSRKFAANKARFY